MASMSQASMSQASVRPSAAVGGPLTEHDDDARVKEWLTENKFSNETMTALEGYSGLDLIELSKDDCKELLGTKDGIRLFNRLRFFEKAKDQVGSPTHVESMIDPLERSASPNRQASQPTPIVGFNAPRPTPAHHTPEPEAQAEAEAESEQQLAPEEDNSKRDSLDLSGESLPQAPQSPQSPGAQPPLDPNFKKSVIDGVEIVAEKPEHATSDAEEEDESGESEDDITDLAQLEHDPHAVPATAAADETPPTSPPQPIREVSSMEVINKSHPDVVKTHEEENHHSEESGDESSKHAKAIEAAAAKADKDGEYHGSRTTGGADGDLDAEDDDSKKTIVVALSDFYKQCAQDKTEVQQMNKGEQFVVYEVRETRKHKPVTKKEEVVLFYEPEAAGARLGSLYWCQRGNKRVKLSDHCIHIHKIIDLVKGVHPKIFELDQKQQATIVSECCFSVVGTGSDPDTHITLNIVASNPKIASVWLSGFQFLLESSGMSLVVAEGKTRMTVVKNTDIAVPVKKGEKIKVGFLNKLGGVRKNWKERYFQRNGDFLEYFIFQVHEKVPFKLAGKIPLVESAILDVQQDAFDKTDVFGIRCSGIVKTKAKSIRDIAAAAGSGRRTYMMEANSPQDKAEWCAYLRQVIRATRDEGKKAEESYGKKPPADGVTREGFLEKLGGMFMKAIWQKRFFQSGFFENTGHCLRYFEVQQNKDGVMVYKQVGSIPLDGAKLNTVKPEIYGGRENLFAITPAGARKTYILQAKTELERKEWLSALIIHVGSKVKLDPSDKYIKVGFMMKRGEVRNKKFKERYFVLTHDRLKYFKKHTDVAPCGQIPLFPGTTLSIESKEVTKQDFAFSIRPAHSKRAYFCCPSDEASRTAWMTAIGDVIKQMQTENAT